MLAGWPCSEQMQGTTPQPGSKAFLSGNQETTAHTGGISSSGATSAPQPDSTNAALVHPRPKPTLDDLLQQDECAPTPVILEDMVPKITYFIERDELFLKEVGKLGNAVVMYGESPCIALEAHQVVKMAVDTGLVREEELQVAKIREERFLVHLPRGLTVDTFIRALLGELWEQGF